MLLVIDAGNTNVVFAVYEGQEQRAAWRCRTEAARTADEYAAFLYQLFSPVGLSFQDISDVIIASVVPEVDFNLDQFCQKTLKCDPWFIGKTKLDLGLVIDVPGNPRVGADCLMNAVAAKVYYRTPAIIVDFGTATTFDVLDQKGNYIGISIAPGINLSLQALHTATAKLPKIMVVKPERVVGQNTIEAMHSGIYWGYVSMVEGMIRRMADEMKFKPFVIGTGGLAPLLAEGTDVFDIVDGDLTLKGLLHVYHQNRKRK